MNKKKLASNIIKYRWYIVFLIPIITLMLFIGNIKNAGVETDWKIWFDKDSKIMKNFESFKETFGSDDRVLLALKSNNGIFNRKVLNNIETITEELWKMKYVARVDSITNFQYSYVSEDDKDEIIVENFLENINSLSNKELKKKEKIALSDPQTKGLLVSKDGKSAVIMVRMVYSKNLKPKDSIEMYENVNNLINKNKLNGVEYYNIGVPAYTKAFVGAIKSNMSKFMPILLLTVILLLIFIFRNIWGVVLPISIVLLTILFIAGFTFSMGYKLNTLTSMFPIFVIAVGIADSIHIFWTWLHKRKDGWDNNESVIYTIEKNFKPALITSLTTFVGFLSLGVTKIIPLQAFSIVVATGAIVAFLLSILFLPAMLSVLNPKIKIQRENKKNLKKIIKKYTNFIVNHDKKIIAVSVLGILISVIGFKDISIDTDFLKQFSKNTEIRKNAEFFEKNIGGTVPVEIIIDSKSKSGINNPIFMKDVEKFKTEFQKKFSNIRHISSLTDVVKKYNQLMNENKKEYYSIPDSKKLISQYMLLYSLSLPQGMGINDLMDVDSRYLRLTAMINVTSELKKIEMYKWTENWWKTNSNFTATVEGLTMISAHMRTELTNTMIKSISLALIFVTLIFWYAFKNKFFMFVSTIPNVAPLVVAAGITGWLGINIDLGMAIVFAIIIGVAIDDTVHFLSKYKTALSKNKNVSEAIEESFLLSGSAIIITTVILVIGLGTFLLSDFALYKNFGFVSSFALFLAMVLDLLLLPALLSAFHKE